MLCCETRKTAFGPVTLTVESGCVVALTFGLHSASPAKTIAKNELVAVDRLASGLGLSPSPDKISCQNERILLEKAFEQLNEYFDGSRRVFSLPLKPEGTPFMLRVWDALCSIPYGMAISYQDLAERIGNRQACRAVGQANHRNPIPIIIPCHRVINKDGGLGGFGCGLEFKRRLLALEGFIPQAETFRSPQ